MTHVKHPEMFLKICFMLFICGISNTFQQLLHLSSGSECQLNETSVGICRPITECTSAILDLRPHHRPDRCSFEGRHDIVCCDIDQTEESPLTTLVPVQKKKDVNNNRSKHLQKCLEYENLYKGFKSKSAPSLVEMMTNSQTGNFTENIYLPHMVFIGFGDPPNLTWYCAGTLISENFVLSAAHCFDLPKENKDKAYVTLPNFNRTTALAERRTQSTFKIVQVMTHPDFKPPSIHNNVILLKLGESVQFNEYVLPACLYDKDDVPGFGLSTTIINNGTYGINAGVDFVQVDLHPCDRTSCNETIIKMIRVTGQKNKTIDETQFIATWSGEKNGICLGLGGSAVQIQKSSGIYDVVSITTQGTRRCIAGLKLGIYTRVSPFVSWIDSVVWP